MKGVSKRVPSIHADQPKIAYQIAKAKRAKTAMERADALFCLFKMVWRLPVNQSARKLTRSYLWPNLREWRKACKYSFSMDNLRCYCITAENIFKHLKTGQENG